MFFRCFYCLSGTSDLRPEFVSHHTPEINLNKTFWLSNCSCMDIVESKTLKNICHIVNPGFAEWSTVDTILHWQIAPTHCITVISWYQCAPLWSSLTTCNWTFFKSFLDIALDSKLAAENSPYYLRWAWMKSFICLIQSTADTQVSAATFVLYFTFYIWLHSGSGCLKNV